MDTGSLMTMAGVTGNFDGEVLKVEFKDGSPARYLQWTLGDFGGWCFAGEGVGEQGWQKQVKGGIKLPGRGVIKYAPLKLNSPGDLPTLGE
ncbi:MAG: hypothetical protein HQ530_03410 [Parcubacteria group bacterium]|nr:hypothetical protein [Parcubacteria group bacterium]